MAPESKSVFKHGSDNKFQLSFTWYIYCDENKCKSEVNVPEGGVKSKIEVKQKVIYAFISTISWYGKGVKVNCEKADFSRSLDTLDKAMDFAEYLSMFENDDYENDNYAFENPFSNDFLQ